MKAEEIVKALRACSEMDCANCPAGLELALTGPTCYERLLPEAADALEKLLDRCAQYAEEIAVLQERQRWIPVTERRPADDGHYLCRYGFDGGNAVFYQTLDYYATDVQPHFQHEGMHRMRVTHWMPLPEALEVER